VTISPSRRTAPLALSRLLQAPGSRIDPTLNPVPKPAPLREARRFDHARNKVTPIQNPSHLVLYHSARIGGGQWEN